MRQISFDDLLTVEQKRADQIIRNRRIKLQMLFEMCEEADWLDARPERDGLLIVSLASGDQFKIEIGDSFSILDILQYLGLLVLPKD